MMKKKKENRHITEEMWIAVEADTVNPKGFFEILEHTCDCTWCAKRLADIMEQAAEQEAYRPPAYLKEQIAERTKQLDVQAAAAMQKTSKRMQLLLYNLQVSAGVAFSILLLVLTANFRNPDVLQPGREETEQTVSEQESPSKDEKSLLNIVSDATYVATEKMNEFANQLLNGGRKE